MSRSKEKRIKKFRKKHIWPSIVGLILILLIFILVMVLAFDLAVADILQRKWMDSSSKSVTVSDLFEDYNAGTKDEIEQKVLTYIEALEVVDAVSVVDADRKPVWSSSGEYPVMDELIKWDIMPQLSEKEIGIIIADEGGQIFTVDNGEIGINEDVIIEFLMASGVEEDIEYMGYDDMPTARMKLWLVIPVNGLEVLVLNNVPVYYTDLLMMGVCIILCSILIAVFVIYYVISMISMFRSMHKTTKIIYTDMVTGGDNWLMFIKKGTSLLKKNKKARCNYAVLHLKMRKYRSFCTCFGVNKGQELIEKFYATLKNEIQRNEVTAHHENAAFGLLLEYTDAAQLEERIRKIESMLSEALPGIKTYFGVGVYLIGQGENDIEQLYNNAMIACEMLGEESENKIAYFDVEMNNRKLWERKVEDDMDRALANREFQVYLQPKISTSEEVLGGAEALVRWIHPTEGFIPPNRFIPIFEKNGFILKLDDYMLEEIAKVQAEWLAQGRKLVPISVNVSRAHFTREDLAEHICAIVDKYNVPHDVIELELTESAFFDDKKVLLNTVQKLRASGFRVSMDDFGAGYSSLNSLKELQIDVLKIDADFFRGADVEERGLLIVSEVIDLAKKLNMKIVAEGIESKDQVEFLTAQECDLIQGYFYAKPMPVAEFAEKYSE
ncbi:MAG: EAL domain-containing protein [Oscillospiraceae bacterium]|nr:EAL domain-containing protein [Oscillospiraceae bacterium]